MRIIMLGGPGSGKGTYSQRLSPIYNLPHISTGAIFREHIKNETELGMKVKSFVDAGDLVPDDITNSIAEKRLQEPDCVNGYIFDGYPRTLPQAEALDTFSPPDVAMKMDVSDEIIIKRLTSRVQCKKCEKIYNLLYLKPEQEGICDKCGGELHQRPDDTEEVVKGRIKVHEEKTEKPLIEYYGKQGKVRRVTCPRVDIPPEEIVEKIVEILKEFK
jgi:adenylate kinase